MRRMLYHGTSTKRKAASIRRDGFCAGTWFAQHMEDAVCYGGKYVFVVQVSFPYDKRPRSSKWQVCCSNALPATVIRGMYVVEGGVL